jgi:ubiquinone/menaquinone biosynthesis C-methylase UbiE
MMPKGSTLLEVGCGTGALLCASADKFERVIGLDLMRERLKIAGGMVGESPIQLLLADMDVCLPFRDNTLSCIVCIAAFEYAHDPFYFLDEVRRVLVPTGSLLLQVANLVWLPRRMTLFFGRIPPTGARYLAADRSWNGGYLHSFTLPDLKDLLRECDFRIEGLASSSRLGRISKLWPSLLSSDFLVLCKKNRLAGRRNGKS